MALTGWVGANWAVTTQVAPEASVRPSHRSLAIANWLPNGGTSMTALSGLSLVTVTPIGADRWPTGTSWKSRAVLETATAGSIVAVCCASGPVAPRPGGTPAAATRLATPTAAAPAAARTRHDDRATNPALSTYVKEPELARRGQRSRYRREGTRGCPSAQTSSFMIMRDVPTSGRDAPERIATHEQERAASRRLRPGDVSP